MKGVRRTVGETGEFNLIDRIRKILPVSRNRELRVDIGDDTAVVALDRRRALLLTCDIQVEGRHFLFDRTTPYRVGRKSMAVNLSDIASMGGKPTYALVSLGLPADLPVESFERLFEGMRDEMRAYGAYVIGGNLARTREELVVDVTLLGEAELSKVLTRDGARPGDRIFVTGTLGASAAGMEALRIYGKKVPGKYRELADRHVLPVPRVGMGQKIARSGVASAMIDLSDGVAGDLYHICERSGVGAEIREELLPLPERIAEIAEKSGRSVLDLALHNGEDYELLFTVPPGAPERKIRALPGNTGIPVTEIGRIVDRREGYCRVDAAGRKTALKPSGWDHFREEPGGGKRRKGK
ncbi:MAG: thiamine-phosphate kinase [Thermodesulfobacteriota bacterium]